MITLAHRQSPPSAQEAAIARLDPDIFGESHCVVLGELSTTAA